MIKIYNTLTRRLEEFIPIHKGEVSMYVCGPTVYNYIHIGNARPAIFFDTVRRYFEFRGYKVKYVQNFTDVDDKIIKRANEENISCEEVAEKYIKAYFEDTQKVNLLEEGMIRPRATKHIGEMIKIIKSLIDKGYAYEKDGDVYFEVEKYKDKYLELSHQNVDDLRSGARIEVSEIKKSPLDFALWKSAKPNEPSWNSPWGQGRPGWHIECSAMSSKYLGDTFDIHGGGQDLIFPHHENEIAQSKCGCDGEYAHYWMHNGYININGEKMSKSLGNFFLLRDVLEHYDGRVIRLFTLSAHYRKPIDFSDAELNQAKVSLERIENAILTALELEINEKGNSCENLAKVLQDTQEKFIKVMDEDFNTSSGLGAIFELVRELNKTKDINGVGKLVVDDTVNYIKLVMTQVLGVELNLTKNVGNMTSELIEFLLEIRKEARNDKNWVLSDKIRDRLIELGIKLKDGKDKTSWQI